MEQIPQRAEECNIKMEAAIAALTMSSARLKNVIFSGPDDAVETAFVALRMARMRFLAVRAECQDIRAQLRLDAQLRLEE